MNTVRLFLALLLATFGSAVAGEVQTVRAQKGDSLQTISQRVFGTTRRWKDILELNRDRLPTAAALSEGMELKLPPGGRSKKAVEVYASTEDVSPAVSAGELTAFSDFEVPQ